MRPIKKTQPDYFVSHIKGNDALNRTTIQNALIDALGNYCSYCEMPLSGYQIEHHRTLSHWQSQIHHSQWEDLLLICADCRSHIKQETLREEDAENLLWPDRNDLFGLHGLSPICYELRDVKYIVVDGGENSEPKDMALVFAVVNAQCDTTTQRKAQNTIDHFQLNMPVEFFDSNTNKLTVTKAYHDGRKDNRMFKRTETWHEAQDSANKLRALDAYSHLDKIETFRKLLKDQISMTAYYSGNWSIWMTVFNNELKNSSLLHDLFVSNPRYFPGTNTDANLFGEK